MVTFLKYLPFKTVLDDVVKLDPKVPPAISLS